MLLYGENIQKVNIYRNPLLNIVQQTLKVRLGFHVFTYHYILIVLIIEIFKNQANETLLFWGLLAAIDLLAIPGDYVFFRMLKSIHNGTASF